MTLNNDNSNRTIAESIFRSLRRIIRAVDLHSREMTARFQMTAPQLVCLRQLWVGGPCALGELARQVYLSQATITGIVDRLEARGMVFRHREDADRRKVTISLTEEGERIAAGMPLPLQDRFAERLNGLPLVEQEAIERMLCRIVGMMEAGDIDAWPIIASGSITTCPDDPAGEANPTDKSES